MALKTRYSPLEQLSLENVYNSFIGLGPREKMVALAVLALLVLALLFLPFSLASGKIRSMRRQIQTLQSGTEEVRAKIEEYHIVKKEIDRLERKLGGGGSLTSRVEGVANKLGLAVKQLNEKPMQTTDHLEIASVEVRFNEATLSQLVDFFYEIERDRSALMRIRRVQIKPRYSNRQVLEVSLEVATFAPRREA